MQDIQQQGAKNHTTLLVIALVIAVVFGAVGIGVAIGRSHTSSATTSSEAVTVEQACRSWMGAYRGTAQPPSDWCNSMWSWMNGRVQRGMMGTAMWGSAEQMRAACTTWMGANANAGTWCDDMVEWMQGQATQSGGWRGWMMQP